MHALRAYRFAQCFVEAARDGPYRRHTSPAACCCLLFTRIRSRQPAMSQDRLAEHPIDPLGEFNRGWAQRASALVLVLSKTRWVPPGKTEAPAPAAEPAGGRWPVRLQRVSGGAHA